VQKLVLEVEVEVEDQDRALRFWTDGVGFELVQNTPYEGNRFALQPREA
jgi:catechol 2,3-dioxygenase-like lactoylglutathione lyase family enzyme